MSGVKPCVALSKGSSGGEWMPNVDVYESEGREESARWAEGTEAGELECVGDADDGDGGQGMNDEGKPSGRRSS